MRTSPGPDGDWTDLEAEGQPELDEQPPGIDSETASEGQFPPRDHPLGVDEHGVTGAEQEMPESVADRARREQPDVTEDEEADPAGRLVEDGDGEGEAVGEWADDGGGLSAEEAAVHVRRR